MSIASTLSAHLPSGEVPGINLEVSDESHDGWRALAQRLGMSQRVMFEMLGRYLTPDVIHPDILQRIEEEGRALTAARARKGGPKPKKRARKKPAK